MSLRKFDIFPKLDNEFRIGTAIGGILSLLSIITTIILSWVEIHAHLHPPTRQRLIVDSIKPTELDGITISSKSQPRFDVFLDVTFPSAPCYVLHFDVLDSVTQFPLPLDEINSTFNRLDPSGRPLGQLSPDFLETPPSSECGSCYLEPDNVPQCCKSCQDVFAGYRSKGFRPPPLTEVTQCHPISEKVHAYDSEGCRITSEFRAVRVAGEFHIAPGLSWFSEGWHVHDVQVFGRTFEELNLTHTIDRLQFSRTAGNMPLDGKPFTQEAEGKWKVVYTVDVLGDNFSVSRYGMVPEGPNSPGIFMKYDVSPITATTYLDKEPLLHLATRLLTVIGGVLGLFRVLDVVLYRSSKASRPQKLEE
jgi:hypothetical protein